MWYYIIYIFLPTHSGSTYTQIISKQAPSLLPCITIIKRIRCSIIIWPTWLIVHVTKMVTWLAKHVNKESEQCILCLPKVFQFKFIWAVLSVRYRPLDPSAGTRWFKPIKTTDLMVWGHSLSPVYPILSSNYIYTCEPAKNLLIKEKLVSKLSHYYSNIGGNGKSSGVSSVSVFLFFSGSSGLSEEILCLWDIECACFPWIAIVHRLKNR